MNVTSINTATAQYQPTIQHGFKQRAQDFKALRNALKSGDLEGAQQAFATLQADAQSFSQAAGPTSHQSSRTSQIEAGFQALQSALQSGDLSGAKSAFATLKLDMQHAGGAFRAHGHHQPEQSSDNPSSTTQAPDSAPAEADTPSDITPSLDTQASGDVTSGTIQTSGSTASDTVAGSAVTALLDTQA